MENLQNILEVEAVKDGTDMAPSIQGDVDLSKEWNLMTPEWALNHLVAKEVDGKIRLYLAGERVILRFSKKGFLYATIKQHMLRGSVRKGLFIALHRIASAQYVGKLGKYEVERGIFNGTELYFCFTNQELSFIASKDAIDRMATKLAYREDFETFRTTHGNTIQVPAISHEIYGNAEASLGWLYIENLLEQLEKASDLIAVAKQSNHPEVQEKLQEIKELLGD